MPLHARGLAPAIAAAVLAGTATALVAMPTRLVILAQSLAAPRVVVPSTLSALAAAGVPTVLTKLKLVTLGGLVAAAAGFTLGAGAGLLPGAAAQAEKPAPPTAEAPNPADQERLLRAAMLVQEQTLYDNAVFALVAQKQKAAAKFEYRIHDFPTAADQFKKLLESEAVEGFELAAVTPPATDGGARFTPLVVFKRPNPKLVAGATEKGVVLNTKASWDAVRSDERATPDPMAERLKAAREAVAVASKLAVAPRARLQKLIGGKIIPMDSSPESRSAEATSSLLAKAEGSLRGQAADAASTARIYLDEAHEALKTAKEAELSAAVRIAVEAVKRAEGGMQTHPAQSGATRPQLGPDAVSKLLELQGVRAEHAMLRATMNPQQAAQHPKPTAPPAPAPQPRMPLTTTPPPVAPDQAVENFRALILGLRTESELRKIQADIQKARDAKRRESDTTPEQAAKVVEALKALGVRATVSQTAGTKGLADIMAHNPRPGDLELAEAMIRAVNADPTTRVTVPSPIRPIARRTSRHCPRPPRPPADPPSRRRQPTP